MTEKRGKGKGPAWQDLVNASVEDAAPATPARVTPRGQRNKQKATDSATPVSPPKTADEAPRPVLNTPSPPRRQPKRAQFNVRLNVELIERVRGESAEWAERGYQRSQADILEDALTLYYAMKDDEEPQP